MSIDIAKDLDLVDINIISISGSRDGNLPINHVNVETKIGFFKSETTLGYKVDYEFKFNNQVSEERVETQSLITVSFGVNFFIKNSELYLGEKEIEEIGQFAILTAHPFARVQVASIANSLRLPSVTLGILQKGKDRLNSVTVGDQVFNF
jgi:hypothetical protein